ncbi:hypothetical protein HR059_03510 [Sinorhizobium meliloti WSM1022]|uniref:hypothetical protein n=1 Tax=Rhizobium meliloti TaxID=382 RepID=UPI0004830841|nr:hypothetical protein [Sinorhizobium meliloti]MDW9841132.1 hypothetical protein [Sinorhizobium meliloti]QKN13567.1 hypothetical protein HR059_03510 [Sinorhizobium meliloti WSM1022]
MSKNVPARNDLKEWLKAHVRKKHMPASEADCPDDLDAMLEDLDLGPVGGEPDDGLSDILDDGTSGEKFTLADLWAWDEARQKEAKETYDRGRYEKKALKVTGKLPRRNEKLSHLTLEQKEERKAQQRREAAARQYERKKQQRAEQKT